MLNQQHTATNAQSTMHLMEGQGQLELESVFNCEALSSEENAIVNYLALSEGVTISEALERLEDVEWQHGSTKDAAYAWAKCCFGRDDTALQFFDCEAFARDCVAKGEWTELSLGNDEYLTIINELEH